MTKIQRELFEIKNLLLKAKAKARILEEMIFLDDLLADIDSVTMRADGLRGEIDLAISGVNHDINRQFYKPVAKIKKITDYLGVVE